MVLPLTLLRAAQNKPMMVELKSGETYSGLLASCDGFMNLHLKDSVCTSKDGEKFWKLTECYIRGNTIKYIRLQEEILDTAAKEEKRDPRDKPRVGRGRGGGAGGGGGRGGSFGGAGRGRGGGGGSHDSSSSSFHSYHSHSHYHRGRGGGASGSAGR